MDDELRQVLEEMQRDNAAGHAETRRHFDVMAEERRHELRIVAEGVGLTCSVGFQPASRPTAGWKSTLHRLEAPVAKVTDNLDTRVTRLEAAFSRC